MSQPFFCLENQTTLLTAYIQDTRELVLFLSLREALLANAEHMTQKLLKVEL